MVAAPHVLAAEAGRAMFTAGGNALDAAIAAAATIAVVYPHMNSIGGDNFWLIYDARAGRLRALNACGRSAAGIDADAYRARYGPAMPVRGGAAAIMVPGVVSGWWEAHRTSRNALGSPIPWKSLLEAAVRHARDGFDVSPGQRRVTAGASALFAATSFPPPTQGFAALAILALLDGFDVAGLDDADYVHVIVEATKLAFEDRDRYLADPTMVTVPVERCLDAARLARRRSRISRRAAMAVGGPPADGDTIAIVTADAAGNAVSVIQSTYHEFGAAVVAGGTGVLLQNRGAFFSLDPGHPNALAPRKRTAHTLIPSIYVVGGRARFVYGTMGGEGQPQTQAALVTRLVDRGLGPQAAVEAPRWLYGRTWGEPSKALRLESRFGDTVATALGERGHDVRVVEPWSDLMGHAQCIALADGALLGGSDPRADGAALGC